MILENVDVVLLTEFAAGLRSAGGYRIATEIRKHNYSCQVIDLFSQLKTKDLVKALEICVGSNTKILGISTTFANMLNLYSSYEDFSNVDSYNAKFNYVVDLVKKINPDIMIVVGGANVLQVKSKNINAIATGYADVAIIKYLQYLDGKNPFFPIEKNKQGQIVLDGNKHNTLFDFNNSVIEYQPHDNIIHGESLVLEVARGCIFKCSFCNYPLNGKKKNDYIKNESVLKEELLKNYYEHGTTSYIVADDTHNDNLVKLESLARVSQSLPFQLRYSAYIRIELLKAHPEQYSLLKDSGLFGAYFGIETLNHESGKSVGKGMHPDKVVDELANFRDRLPDVGTAAGFIVGLPYDSKESVYEWTGKILDKNFPLDEFDIVPLTLDTENVKVFKSEFDSNWSKYYTMNNGAWHNGYFDREWARKFCEQTRRTALGSERYKIGGFRSIVMLNVGLDCNKQVLTPSFFLKLSTQPNRYKDILFANTTAISSIG